MDNITLARYSKENHLDHIKFLLLARDMQSDSLDTLPAEGFVAFNEGTPVAAGFLRKCEGGYCLIDSLISNPNEPSAIRNKALDSISMACVELAKAHKFKHIIAFTVDKNVILRSEKHGFRLLPHSIIGLDLISEQGII